MQAENNKDRFIAIVTFEKDHSTTTSIVNERLMIQYSKFFSDAIPDNESDILNSEIETIPLPNITKVLLEQIIHFLEYYDKYPFESVHQKDENEPLKNNKINKFKNNYINTRNFAFYISDKWYYDFCLNLGRIHAEIMDLHEAANYLCIDSLMEVIGTFVACSVFNKTWKKAMSILTGREYTIADILNERKRLGINEEMDMVLYQNLEEEYVENDSLCDFFK